MKEDIFSKLSIRNYTNELEIILEEKDFSTDVKNLLLNMLYKINTSYNDYATVKRNVENKNKFIEKILKIIKECKSFELIAPKEEKEERRTFIINKEEKTISSYPNEKSMLYAIYYLGNKRMYLNEEYNLLRIAIPGLLNEGKDNNNVEIIRDFNAWSWYTVIDEITNLNCNLIYQNIQILLGYDKLNQWMNLGTSNDCLKILENELNTIYDENNVHDFLKLIYQIAIGICVSRNESEKKRLLDEKKYLEIEFDRLKDKKTFLLEISNKKKQLRENIKDIDCIINDKELLEKEYKKRNKKLPEYSKIFGISHLEEILSRERKRKLKQIEEYNGMLEPKNYVKAKSKTKRELELLVNVDLDKNPELEKQVLKLQNIFLKCFKEKIENAQNKKEIIDLIYILRYYNFIPYNKNMLIKEVKELKKNIKSVMDLLIEKMSKFKVVNKISNNKEFNLKAIETIFYTRIMSLENIKIEFVQKEKKLFINLYDGEIFEKTQEIDIGDIQVPKIKLDKKIDVFC